MGPTVTSLAYSCTYLVTFILFLCLDGWSQLPDPRGQSGIGNRQSSCVGCHDCIRWDSPQHQCRLALQGFDLDGHSYVPCGMIYHLGCIRVGEPFCSHLGGNRGLVYPCTRIAPPFIFEACTVRAQLGTELKKMASHLSLLMLEHMRLIDQANAWSLSMHHNYQVSLGKLQ
jgi:hypothetical protein